MKKVRTRVAPSPTGYPHIGTVYQALFDYAWAKKNGGDFLFRIEDTDKTRFVEGAEDALNKAFGWFGLNPDESPIIGGDYGPYRQSERLDLYKKYALELVEKGHAYYCFCSPERLEQVRAEQQKKKQVPMYDKHCRNLPLQETKKRVESGEKYVIRMKVPSDTKIVVNDVIRGDLEFESNGVDDQVIMKSDGYPTYHLAVVVDDITMEVSHVVRGPEWISSYPKHKLLYQYFGWEMPTFIHTPMITNMDGSKLSKRQGHASVDWYRRKGFLPEAVLNFISLLGWSHPEQKEIFSLAEFIEKFEFVDVSAVSPKFDLTKLEWMNGQYLQSLSSQDFINKILEWAEYCMNNPKFLGAADYISEWNADLYSKFRDYISKLKPDDRELFSELLKSRIKKFEDLLNIAGFFVNEITVDEKILTKQKSVDEVKTHLNDVLSRVNNIEDWNLESLKKLESDLVQKASDTGWKVGEVFYPIRIAISGTTVTPPLFESIYLMGKNQAVNNIQKTLRHLA